MDLAPLQECSICMERAGYAIVVGCDHVYCEICIAEWCTAHRAHCPICRLPIHGLTTGLERVVYLSPHDVPNWGLTVVPQSRVSKRDVFRLDSVGDTSIGAANGLRRNQYVRFFGKHDRPATTISEVEAVTSEAYAEKRLLKVETVPVGQGEEDWSCLECLRRLVGAH